VLQALVAWHFGHEARGFALKGGLLFDNAVLFSRRSLMNTGSGDSAIPSAGSDIPSAGCDIPSAGSDIPSAGSDIPSAGSAITPRWGINEIPTANSCILTF
jgi:hypothetical protein